MKISILSDIHMDFWTKPGRSLKQSKNLEKRLDDALNNDPEIEVLIVAGDISHYNSDFEKLREIAEIWNYKKIFIVLGNHDFYLVSGAQKQKYQNSNNRVNELYEKYGVGKDPLITLFNGDRELYNGIWFGGTAEWYDMSYLRSPTFYGGSEVQEWKRTMNDARLIYGIGDIWDLCHQEHPKLEKVFEAGDVDVMITHICPLSAPIAFQEKYRGITSSKFYSFDGEEYLERTRAKYWVYGHSHGAHEFEVYDTTCVMNALGYPGETNVESMVIEI